MKIIPTGVLLSLLMNIPVPVSAQSDIGISRSPLNVASDMIWPTDRIGVCWEMDDTTFLNFSAQRRLVRTIVEAEYETISAIDFIDWRQCFSNSRGIRINVADKNPHVQKLGRKLDGVENGILLNFEFNHWGRSCRSTSARHSQCIQWDALHEFGHALGFAHEQNRPDTERSSCDADTQGSNGDLFLGQNDTDSVMNYCNKAELSRAPGPTLSPGDVAGIQAVYGAPFGRSETLSGTVRRGGRQQERFSTSGVHLLSGFHFRYRNSDHHIRTVQIAPRSGNGLDLSFNDKNSDDPYAYKAIFQNIDASGVTQSTTNRSCQGSCTLSVTRPAGSVFVLQGFSFQYRHKDHHIDQIGIFEQNGNIRAFFNDKNNDDPFTVTVHYAYVPRSVFIQTGLQAQSSDVRGVDSEFALGGRRVIQGFFFNYASKDHHIEKLGVNYIASSSSRLYVEYADKNDDDRFNWEVFYAILR